MNNRLEKYQSSLDSLKTLLNNIIKNPSKYIQNSTIINALNSQGALAKFEDSDLGIFPTSLNTQKAISEDYIDGGFGTLNTLRCSAQNALLAQSLETKKPSRGSIAELKSLNEQLKLEKQTLRDDLLLLTLALDKALKQSARYAKKSSTADEARCKKEQRELLDILSLRKNPFESNIAKLRND